MPQLSPAGQEIVNNLAQQHGFSSEAVSNMLEAVLNGNGNMAQFNHPEFAGYGQWMRGGMIMVSDMFNNHLKGRIDALCNDLSQLLINQPGVLQTGSFQSQSQGNGSSSSFNQNASSSSFSSPVSLFVSSPSGRSSNWWPDTLQYPNSTGAQNGVRYAYFSQARRLAIEINNVVTVYDVLDHQITGFSQQQSQDGSLTFTSQYGVVEVSSLPVVSDASSASAAPAAASEASNGRAPSEWPVQEQQAAQPYPQRQSAQAFQPSEQVIRPEPSSALSYETDIFSTIKKLADLHNEGILSSEEFANKKTELLSRL